jgi:hypothetical protein
MKKPTKKILPEPNNDGNPKILEVNGKDYSIEEAMELYETNEDFAEYLENHEPPYFSFFEYMAYCWEVEHGQREDINGEIEDTSNGEE